MKKKLKIGVLFGGKSPEHEVSIESAQKVIDALDKKKYVVTSIKIPKDGEFNWNLLKKYDLIIPILHGLFGEDGTVQGLLKLLGIPFVGASVLGSAVGMDKDVMKRLLRDAEIPIGKFIVVRRKKKIILRNVKKKLILLFLKRPAKAGSSVGITKIKKENEFK